jgi:hypothetical protein
MTQGIPGPDHAWLIMMKAMRALTRYAAAGIEDTGLGDSDFRVLEVLLHKGRMVKILDLFEPTEVARNSTSLYLGNS